MIVDDANHDNGDLVVFPWLFLRFSFIGKMMTTNTAPSVGEVIRKRPKRGKRVTVVIKLTQIFDIRSIIHSPECHVVEWNRVTNFSSSLLLNYFPQ